jgi:hypothetical protein
MSGSTRRRLFGFLGLALAAVLVLRLLGLKLMPNSWLVAGWILDVLLGLAELAVTVAAARAFADGMGEGGLLRGYERWIDKEQELGMPRPVAALARLELRFYRWAARKRAA